MARAMYFESNRSSEEGMTAVGTVVMNRLHSGRYPGSVCGIVGQRNQFAQGVLSNPVGGRSWALALAKADAVLAGERHPRVAGAMHFHTAGYTFPYRNMAYVVAAGGNVFYEKRAPGTFTPVHPNVMVAQAERERRRPSETILLAGAEPPAPVAARSERIRLASLEPPEALPRDRAQDRPHAMSAAGGGARGSDRRADLLDQGRGRFSEAERRPAARGADSRLGSQMRTPQIDRTVVARQDGRLPPRDGSKPERIRLAHVDDDAMPRAVRLRSDAAPQGRHAGIALASKAPPGRPEPSRPVTGQGEAERSSAKPASLSRVAAHAEPVRAVAAKPTRPEPGKGEVLAYRDKAKPVGADSPAKLSWKRGPDPAAQAGAHDKVKRRP
jgi:hypothetical protein